VTPRFYCALPLSTGAEVVLPPGPAHHAARVLRLRVGDSVTLFNGGGGEVAARLTRIDARSVVASVGESVAIERESPLRVRLVQGLSATDRMDYAVQKAVELGVTAIQPVTSARSAARLADERAEKRLDHWRQISIAACEQCGRNRLPLLHPLRELGDWLDEPSEASLRLLLAPNAAQPLARMSQPHGPIDLLIGPEGGLAPDESGRAVRVGFHAMHLGPRILRTETAAVAALAALNTLWGDWR